MKIGLYAACIVTIVASAHGAADKLHGASAKSDTVAYVTPSIGPIPYISPKIDSVLFVKFNKTTEEEDTLARLNDSAFFSRLQKGIATFRDTGVTHLSAASHDSADLGLVVFGHGEPAQRIITLARSFRIDKKTHIKSEKVVGVSIQYSIDAFAWITLTDSFSHELSKLYAKLSVGEKKK